MESSLSKRIKTKRHEICKGGIPRFNKKPLEKVKFPFEERKQKKQKKAGNFNESIKNQGRRYKGGLRQLDKEPKTVFYRFSQVNPAVK